MIRAIFTKSDDRFTGCVLSGHAGYDRSGRDIVCAAVTSALQLSANAITERFGVAARVETIGDRVSLSLPADAGAAACQMLAALSDHLTVLSEDYPGTIQITYTEGK